MFNNIFGNKDYFLELEQLSQKQQFTLMRECNNYLCYYIFNLIYNEIKNVENLKNDFYKSYFIYDNKKVAIISTNKFRYILQFNTQSIRRALQRLQEKGYIEFIELDYGNDIDEEFDAMQIYGSNKYGYAITDKGYQLINNVEV